MCEKIKGKEAMPILTLKYSLRGHIRPRINGTVFFFRLSAHTIVEKTKTTYAETYVGFGNIPEGLN